ncbi:DUF3943 domain-containing protein [Helicobacter jaachi]|uniref:DUF3943 domain-containing protein n=1 Tax=Helicobacter jaachi TaxID=1677920 RepID=A0A4V6I2X6_9HELI|nr:DUF3943 domain-containing protein [Helicobacter jaachi]TLD97802.1 DUF3943 domain-containing protein [Helicobacter jaachi]
MHQRLFAKWRCVLLLAFCPLLAFGDLTQEPTLTNLAPLENMTKSPYIYEPTSRLGYLALGSSLVLGGTLVGAGVLYLMPESVTNWNKEEIVNLDSQWRAKTARGPVVDGDDWFLNWITHPYWGAVYYMQPRIAGYSWSESVLYSIFASALFWEYGVEAFAEVPSWQDLVITPAIGSIFGELFYQATLHINANHNTLLGSRFLGKTALLLMDPVGFILQDFGLAKSVGITNKNQMQSLILPTSSQNGAGVRLMLSYRF